MTSARLPLLTARANLDRLARSALVALVALVALTGAACGGKVDGAPATAGDAPIGAETGSPAITCGVTLDTATISADLATGEVSDCANPTVKQGAAPAPTTATGQLSDVQADSFAIETCPPNADCATTGTIRYHVRAAGLDLRTALPRGSYVQVSWEIMTNTWACQTGLTVRSVTSWGGVANPVPPGGSATPLLLLDVADGGGVRDDAFALETVPLGCNTTGAHGCGGALPDEYAYRFVPAAGSPSVTVGMGETKSLSLSSDPKLAWSARDLRSFQGEACDAYWDWAYWVAFRAP